MSSPPEPAVQPAERHALASVADRRAVIEAKQAQVAALLAEMDCEGLLLVEPENFAWFTGGAIAHGVLDAQQYPGLFVSGDVRALLASNVDSQRLFDEHLDGLGFQLKEWSWYAGREQLLTYLARGRRLASDLPRPDCKPAGDALRRLRRVISDAELTGYRQLGLFLSHALEATCRTVALKQTEQEIAGHLSHRIMKHGVEVISLEVAADDRLRSYRRVGFTTTPLTRHCTLTATARQAGLYVTACRSVCFGTLDAELRKEHDVACKVTATYVSSSWPDAIPTAILQAGKRVYQVNQYEHEWRLAPAGHITGWAPVEQLLAPQVAEHLQAGWAVIWRSSVGAACSCDTFVITSKGPVILSAPGNWPRKRIHIQGASFDRPDILQRS